MTVKAKAGNGRQLRRRAVPGAPGRSRRIHLSVPLEVHARMVDAQERLNCFNWSQIAVAAFVEAMVEAASAEEAAAFGR